MSYTEPSRASQGVPLSPSGMLLAGSPARGLPSADEDGYVYEWEEDGAGPVIWRMVVDGAGGVWVRGPWELTRVDVNSGEARTWDASDDEWFAAPGMEVAPAAGSGVWLLAGAEARLFDGAGFARVLRVPAQVLAGLEDSEHADIYDLVEVGDEVWMSVHTASAEQTSTGTGVVLRWVDGTWSAMSGPADGVGGELSAGDDGAVWAGGWELEDAEFSPGATPQDRPGWDLSACQGGTGRARGPGVRRWDGQSWSLPGDRADAAIPEGRGEVVVDATGAVWVLDDGTDYCSAAGYPSNTEDPSMDLMRFDGTGWQLVADVTTSGLFDDAGWSWENGEETERYGWLAVTGSGDAWVADNYHLVRYGRDGTVTTFDDDQLPPPIRGLAIAGDQVLVLDRRGVSRLQGDRFVPAWEESVHLAWNVGQLVAVSATEVWATQYTVGLSRFADNEWTRVTRDTTPCERGGPVRAADGAVWWRSDSGLIRHTDGKSRVVATGEVGCPIAAVGSGNVVTRAEESDAAGISVRNVYEEVGPTGKRTAVVPPSDLYCWIGTGRDGPLWLTAFAEFEDGFLACEEWRSSPPGDLIRWDGTTWTTPGQTGLLGADLPGRQALGSDSQLAGLSVSGDGALWGWIGEDWDTPSSPLVRYDGKAWSVIATPDRRGLLVPAPDDRMCVHADDTLTCYQPDKSSTTVTSAALHDSTVAVAPDGAVWVVGDQIARLAQLR